jgi:hypothetical protein
LFKRKNYSNSKKENVEKKNNERKLFFGVNTKNLKEKNRKSVCKKRKEQKRKEKREETDIESWLKRRKTHIPSKSRKTRASKGKTDRFP